MIECFSNLFKGIPFIQLGLNDVFLNGEFLFQLLYFLFCGWRFLFLVLKECPGVQPKQLSDKLKDLFL